MKKFAILAAGAALVGSAGVAFAGGVAPEPMAPAPAPVTYSQTVTNDGDWTGAYAGLDLGYNWAVTSSPLAGSGDDVTYGLRGGYDYDMGKWVVGALVNYDWSDTSLSSGDSKLNGIGHVGGRVGYDLGNTLVYGSAGLAMVNAKLDGNDTGGTGYFLGLGVDHKLNGGNIVVGGEVGYNKVNDLGSQDVDFEDTTLGVNVGFRF